MVPEALGIAEKGGTYKSFEGERVNQAELKLADETNTEAGQLAEERIHVDHAEK